MKITFDLEKEELDQLAMMAYLAQFIVDSSGEFTTDYKYPKIENFKAMLRKLNKEILLAFPNTRYVEADEKNKAIFTHTLETENSAHLLLQQFTNEVYLERICSELSSRDYKEHGGTEYEVLDMNVVFTSIYQNNMKELKEHGLKNFFINK
jgi:hypothetical protein